MSAFQGNHDHAGNVSAEIAYSSLSPRWTFPNYWYNHIIPIPTANGTITLELVIIDTVILSGNTDHDGGHSATPPGPAGIPPHVSFLLITPPTDQALADDQWTWIQQTLANSTADYLWVTGHYPVWSVCEHGPTYELVLALKPLLEQYKVTGYASGHDHCLEYLDDGTGVVYVLSGLHHAFCRELTNHASQALVTLAATLPLTKARCPRAP